MSTDRLFLYFYLTFAVAFIAFGLWALRAALRNARRAGESVNWPTVEGEIVELAVRHHGRGGNAPSTFSPVVRYMYLHGDRWITGDCLTFAAVGGGTREHAEDVLARYATARAPRVSVSPDNPEISVLEAGASRWQWVPFGVAAILVTIGVTFLSAATQNTTEKVRTDSLWLQFASGVALFIIGVVLTVYFYKQANRSAQSWPTVHGRVTDVEVREVKYRDELSDSQVTTYRPFVAYAYQRDGKPFTQQTVRFFTASGRATTREQCEDVVNRFRREGAVELYVSPADPSNSVIDPDPPASGMIAVVACAVLPLLGIFVAADAYYRFL